MPTNIPKISARFETSLVANMSATDTSFSLVSSTDKAGNALSGVYGFVIDNGSSTEEFLIGTVSSGTVTIVTRGLDPANPQTGVTALQQAHRKGASVKITDYPLLSFLREMLNGNFTLDNFLQMTAYSAPTARVQLAPKGYVDDVVVGLAGTASASTYGTVKTTTSSNTVVSTDDSRLSSTTALSPTNKVISQSDLQKAAETYVVSTGSANAYAVAYTPAVTVLTAGLKLTFKANFANTGAATLAVNGLTATALVKSGATALASGDISNGQIVEVEYDGTNFQLLSPTNGAPLQLWISRNVQATPDSNTPGNTVVQNPSNVGNGEFICPFTGTLKNFSIKTGSTMPTNPSSVYVQVNDADSALVCTTSSTTTLVTDSTHTVTVNAGDTIRFKLSSGSGGSNQTVMMYNLQLTSS